MHDTYLPTYLSHVFFELWSFNPFWSSAPDPAHGAYDAPTDIGEDTLFPYLPLQAFGISRPSPNEICGFTYAMIIPERVCYII